MIKKKSWKLGARGECGGGGEDSITQNKFTESTTFTTLQFLSHVHKIVFSYDNKNKSCYNYNTLRLERVFLLLT